MAQGKLVSAGMMLDAMLRSAPEPEVNAPRVLADHGEVRQLLLEAKVLQEKLSLILNGGLAAQLF